MASKKYEQDDLLQIRSLWKEIPEEVIPENNRETYKKRKKAVDMYIDGAKLKDITAATGVLGSNIPRLIDKCLKRDINGDYLGYSGLLLYKRTDDSDIRVKGKFGKLLKYYPELEDFIIGCWFGDKRYTLEKNISIKSLHEKFLKKCLDLGVSDYSYPFSTSNKGYVSLSKYVKELNRRYIEKAANRDSKDNKQKLMSTGYGKRYSSNALQPFSVVQLDGHIIDALYNVEIMYEDGTIEHRTATRAWIIMVIDVASRCILGYSVSQEYNYSQHDVIDAIQNAIKPKELKNLTIPGLKYPENGGFYSTAFPELGYALFDSMMLDNARSHLAPETIRKLADVLKCSVNFGSVATPETRGIVERAFGTIESNGFHRLPSTTGSNINDLKRKKPEVAAIKHDITFDEIEQLVEVFIAEYNNKPHSGIHGLTPLECIKKRVIENEMRPTIADDEMVKSIEKLNYITIKRTVRGGTNGRRAYVHYEGTDYRGNELSATGEFFGKNIYLHVDPRDISEVEAYTEDGVFIGILRARGEYGLKSHSLKTHKNARKKARERGRDKMEFDTPISAYEQSLREKAKTSRREATRADIVRQEIGRSKLSEKVDPVEDEELRSRSVIDMKKFDKTKNIKDPDEFSKTMWGF